MSKTLRIDPKYPPLKQFKSDIAKHDKLLKYFIDLNINVMNELFFGSTLEDKNVMNLRFFRSEDEDPLRTNYIDQVPKFPLFLGQVGLLYRYNPGKYLGILNDALLDFLATNFRRNVVFIVNKDGFLLFIMLMQVTKTEKKNINMFFGEHIEELHRFQYLSTEYNPKLDPYKLMSAKTKLHEKCEEVVLTFF